MPIKLTRTRQSNLFAQNGKGVPTRSESDVQSAIIDALRKFGWMVVRINSGSFREKERYIKTYHIFGSSTPNAGFPDLLAMKNERTLFLEVKNSKGKVTDAQQEFRSMAADYGVTTHVVRSVDEVLYLIQKNNTQ